MISPNIRFDETDALKRLKILRTMMPRKFFKVGKAIGGSLYVHKSAMEVLPDTVVGQINHALDASEYEIVKFDTRMGRLALSMTDDWENRWEPVIIARFNVDKDGWDTMGDRPKIYHHKWQFVNPLAAPFDYPLNVARSLAWFHQTKYDTGLIQFKDYWEETVVPQIDEEYAHEAYTWLQANPQHWRKRS